MKRFLALAPLASWSPLVLAHPGHGTLSFADLWPLLTAALLIAIVGVIGLGRGGPIFRRRAPPQKKTPVSLKRDRRNMGTIRLTDRRRSRITGGS